MVSIIYLIYIYIVIIVHKTYNSHANVYVTSVIFVLKVFFLETETNQ
jgi:hypothetical protein